MQVLDAIGWTARPVELQQVFLQDVEEKKTP